MYFIVGAVVGVLLVDIYLNIRWLRTMARQRKFIELHTNRVAALTRMVVEADTQNRRADA